MWKKKRFIVYIIIVSFFVQWFLWSYVFAENQCSACKATPAAMQIYINFEVELLGALQQMSENTESLWGNPQLGLFAGGMPLTKAFLKSTTEKIKKDLDSEIKATRALLITTVLLEKMSLQWFTESFSAIDILFKDEAFVRDYKILEELDMSMNDVIWDMGVSWIWNDKVSLQTQSKILALQSKYSQVYGWEYPIFTRLSISWSVRNRQLLAFILRVNWLMKSTLSSVHNSFVVNTYISSFNSWFSNWNIIAEINEDYIKSIQEDYSCVKMSVCNETIVGALTGLVDTVKAKESFWRSWDTMKEARNHLKELRNPFKTYTNTVRDRDNAWWLTERQVEMLRTVYWLDAKDLTSSQIETRKRNWSNIKKQINPFSNLVKSSEKKSVLVGEKDTEGKIQNEWINQQKVWNEKLTDEEKNRLNDELYWQTILKNPVNVQMLVNELQTTTNDILKEKSNDKEILLAWLNTNTHYFVEIWSYIHYIIDGVIPETMSQLWEACTYQCRNNWTENCYVN